MYASCRALPPGVQELTTLHPPLPASPAVVAAAGPASHPLGDEEEGLPPSPLASGLELGPVVWGTATAKGMRPYMEDRHCIISDFCPKASCLRWRGVPRAACRVKRWCLAPCPARPCLLRAAWLVWCGDCSVESLECHGLPSRLSAAETCPPEPSLLLLPACTPPLATFLPDGHPSTTHLPLPPTCRPPQATASRTACRAATLPCLTAIMAPEPPSMRLSGCTTCWRRTQRCAPPRGMAPPPCSCR